jgi:putative hemin transport protein
LTRLPPAIGVSQHRSGRATLGQGDHAASHASLWPWVELLQALDASGPVMALTRRLRCMKIGAYQNISATGHTARHWALRSICACFFSKHAGFAVMEPASKLRKSADPKPAVLTRTHGNPQDFVRAEILTARFNDIVGPVHRM